jgi:hypothetical protein
MDSTVVGDGVGEPVPAGSGEHELELLPMKLEYERGMWFGHYMICAKEGEPIYRHYRTSLVVTDFMRAAKEFARQMEHIAEVVGADVVGV